MTISLRLSDIDAQMIRAFADHNQETVSAYIRRVVLADIEREYEKTLETYMNSHESAYSFVKIQ